MNKTIILVADEGNCLALAQDINNHLQTNMSVSLINLLDCDFPMYTYPREASEGIAEDIKKVADDIKFAHSLVIVSPEYNGGIPPILSNAFAWFTRATDHWRDCFKEKPVLLASHSYTGAQNLFTSLQIQLTALGAVTLPRHLSVTPENPVQQANVLACCNQLKIFF